jgi:murein DD-endopeptidase MepM/ murein hydrolase activator NlpD
MIYLVQPGDVLVLIAVKFKVKVTDLIWANSLTPPFLIFPGQRLSLPGVPAPRPAAKNLLPVQAEPHQVQAGESLSRIAGNYGVSVGAILLVNNLLDPDVIQVGQLLQIPAGVPSPAPLEPPFSQITLSEPLIIQGRTLVVTVELTEPGLVSGGFEGRRITFTQTGTGRWWGLIPIHALAEPNVYPITLTATLANGPELTTFTTVTVQEGPYGTENIQLDASRGELLTNDLIQQEQQKMIGYWSQVSPRPLWSGPFQVPVLGDDRITSFFGTRRSYNNSPPTSFHGGTDFGGEVDTPVYAPTAGRVVLAERLTIRGYALLIDHGLGLYSGYWHQSQLAVTAGQAVEAGDLIGYIGDTGLVTGPHLHWEMRLYGIAVEPMQWVQQTIP